MIKRYGLACVGMALATTTALAADLPSRRAAPAYVPPIAAPFSWSGLEFGLTTSYSFSSGDKYVVTNGVGGAFGQPGRTSLSRSGFDTVGGGVAYNYQLTPGNGLVIGAAADVNYFNLQKFVYTGYVGGIGGDYQTRLAYFGTANGRLGYAFDHIMVYGVGGFAYGELHTSAYLFSPGVATPYFGTAGNIATGYDFGGGVEYAIPADSFLNYLSVEKLLGKFMGGQTLPFLSFLDNSTSTLRVEFVHYDLGTRTVVANNTAGAGGAFVNRFHTEGNVLRFGLGYKFGGAATPVVARY